MDSSCWLRVSRRLKSPTKTSATRLSWQMPTQGAIDIDLSTADALPAFIEFHHGLDSASCLPIFYKIYFTGMLWRNDCDLYVGSSAKA
jgi:hypothetical protein